jgi:CheY-like chemotaxis protein
MASNIWIKVVGFSDTERHSLNTLFRLSSRHDTPYALWSPETPSPPHLALMDMDSYGAGLELASPSFNPKRKLICVGTHAAAGAWHAFQRPVDWNALVCALDGLFANPGVDIDLDLEEPSERTAPPGAKATLLVGMTRENRLYLRARLALAGLTGVDDADTAVEADSKIAQKTYDLVIVGLELSDADPWALVQALQKMPTPVRSVIVATVAPSWSAMEQTERLGCTGLLEIPFNPRQVLDLLQKV